MARTIETDLCIVGAGISAALLAEKLTERHDLRVLVVEAGRRTTPLQERFQRRERYLAYGENPWVGDHIPDQTAQGIMSRSMTVGGLAMHWGGTVPRYSPEDFRLRSLYGVGTDWPFDYDELDPFYQEAEERIGVAGEQGPEEWDPRSRPYPMPVMPLSQSLQRLRDWVQDAGVPAWTNPVAKTTVPYRGRNVCQRCDTCNICPTGAKYTPDFTLDTLVREGRVELLTQTLVRKLELAQGSERVERALAVSYEQPDETVEIRAGTFVLAGGYAWSTHLLLLSANASYPDGLANRTGNVGRWMTGHRNVSAFIELPLTLHPGSFSSHSLLSKKFERPRAGARYLRHDFRVWESTVGRTARLRNDDGELLLGDEMLADWRARVERGTARVRCYYDVIPDRDSRLTLDSGVRNRFGDPMPRLDFRDDPVSAEARTWSEEQIRGLFDHLARAGDGRVLRSQVDAVQDHPGGGCRMGDDPATSVVDRWGRTHDHENLFVVGAPTIVGAGCNNGTLTFAALTLRSAEEIGRAFPERRLEPPLRHG